jgi:hypothetical protein
VTTQREKDKGAAWAQTDMSANPKEIFADGAEYARKEWLGWCRNFEKYHRDCLDEEAREHLKARIKKLEQP